MNTTECNNFIGIYDQPSSAVPINWEDKVIDSSSRYRAISYVVKQSPEFNKLLSQQHEFYVRSYLTSEYFRRSLQELYGEDDKLIDVIELDNNRQIQSELNTNHISTPDFLVILKRHVLTLDAKSSPEAIDLSSNQIHHGNTEQVVRSSPTLQEILSGKIKSSRLGYVRGKFVLPERQRYIDYLSSLAKKGSFYTERVYNFQNLDVVDEWRDAFLCPSTILLEAYKPYVYYVSHKLGLSYNSVDYIDMLSKLTANDNLRLRVPGLRKNQELLVKTPYEIDGIVQNITLALLMLSKEEYGTYENIDYYFDKTSNPESISGLVDALYESRYFLSYELAAKLHPKFLRAAGNALQKKRIPTTFIPYTDSTGTPHLAKLACYGKTVTLRNVREKIEDRMWQLFNNGEVTLDNYEEALNGLIAQGAESVSASVKEEGKNFNSANFRL